jgi:hypothetical protein
MKETTYQEDKERFYRLMEEWTKDTSHLSITFYKYAHPAYFGIVGMGEKALPFIFQTIGSGRWNHALQAITQVDIPPEIDTLEKSIKFWLDWDTHLV